LQFQLQCSCQKPKGAQSIFEGAKPTSPSLLPPPLSRSLSAATKQNETREEENDPLIQKLLRETPHAKEDSVKDEAIRHGVIEG